MSDTFRPGELSPDNDSTVDVGSYRSAATVTLLRPVAGETLTIGEVHEIAWTTSPKVRFQSFTLELSTDNGSTWAPIADEIHTDDRTHAWEVPDSASATCKIRLTGNRIAGGVTSTGSAFIIA